MISPSRKLRRRLRQTAAVLVEDSSVRAELNDEQAKELIKWGMDKIKAEAARTVLLPDEEALPMLEEKTTAVRTIMLLVNKLVRPGDSEEDTGDQLTRLLKNLSWVTGRPSGMAHLRRAKRFQKHCGEIDQEKAFQLLMDLLHLPMSDEEE